MSNLVIDTHAAIWYFSKSANLSKAADDAINNAVADGGIVFLPTISIVEIVYLIEKGRLVPQTLSTLMDYLELPNSSFMSQDLTPEIAEAVAQISRTTVPDMPDRIIAATALQLNLPLVTKDDSIRALANVQIIW